ncbi:hypothetical protein CBA19CS11_30930 [Caballeronia novacaledonica]|nr:hypothetical protein CBA19CS11_30930 [Caballeronia novacaledonica]
MAQIARSFNAFVGKINSVMVEIRDTSETVRHAANEIASGNHDLSRRTGSVRRKPRGDCGVYGSHVHSDAIGQRSSAGRPNHDDLGERCIQW